MNNKRLYHVYSFLNLLVLYKSTKKSYLNIITAKGNK